MAINNSECECAATFGVLCVCQMRLFHIFAVMRIVRSFTSTTSVDSATDVRGVWKGDLCGGGAAAAVPYARAIQTKTDVGICVHR